MPIDAIVTPDDLARVTGIDPRICKIYLAALKQQPLWSDHLIDPYPTGGGSYAAAAQIGTHVVELSSDNLPTLSCFYPGSPGRRHDDWSLAVTDNSGLVGVTLAGMLMVSRRQLPEILRDLLATTFTIRPGSWCRLDRPRGSIMNLDYRGMPAVKWRGPTS